MNEPGSPEWIAARKHGIGASEAAAVLGLSKWTSPLDIYLRKTQDGIPTADNLDTKRGRLLERAVLDWYEFDHGAIERNLARIDSAQFPFMFASLDARRVDDRRPVECKTVGPRALAYWGEVESGEIPQEYFVQVTHQMIVTGATSADLAALKAGEQLDVYRIEYDAEIAEMIVEGLRQFWTRVENREPPPPQTGDEAGRLYRRSKAQGVEAPAPIAKAYAELLETRAVIQPLAEREEKLISDIKLFMADRDALLVGGSIVATWKTPKDGSRFDVKRFERDQPETYRQYLTPTVRARRFLLKGEDHGIS
jgi:putative phage-type endonuclease